MNATCNNKYYTTNTILEKQQHYYVQRVYKLLQKYGQEAVYGNNFHTKGIFLLLRGKKRCNSCTEKGFKAN